MRDISQALSSVVKEIDFADHISQAEYKTAADKSRDKGSKDLAQSTDNLLRYILVIFGSSFHCVFTHALDAGVCGKFIVKYGYLESILGGGSSMIKHATPERVAFPVEALAQFMQVLEKKEMRMHSVLMMRGEEIFFEKCRNLKKQYHDNKTSKTDRVGPGILFLQKAQ